LDVGIESGQNQQWRQKVRRGLGKMKMKVSGLENIEFVGEITGFHESDGYLIMDVRLTTPVGWKARAALTHKDLMNLVKLLLLKPAGLRYIFFGFGKPDRFKARSAGGQ